MNDQLNTFEIDRFMRKDPFIRQMYGGVKAIDQLDILPKEPSIYIINHDPSTEPGTHWIALFIDSTPEHFDSLGHYPINSLQNYIIINGPNYIVNTKRVQSYTSNSCGIFCLFFSYFRCRGYSFNEIMHMFSDNLVVNEFVVQSFYNITK